MERDRIAALKRSFEVEDVDTSSHSPGSRRTTNSPHRNAMSPTSIYYRELGTASSSASNNNNHSLTQPRSIMGGGGSKTPEPVSRRSELSIDITSSSSCSNKQLDNVTSPGSVRYLGNSTLKRPEVLGHSKSSDLSGGHKREVTFAKASPGDPLATRRNDTGGNHNNNGSNNGPSSARTPEQNHHARGPGSDTRKPEITVTRAPPAENNGHHQPHPPHPPHPNPHHNTIVTTFRCSSPSQAGRKSPVPSDRSEVNPSHSNMTDSAKLHQPHPPPKGERSHAGDFSYVGIDAILEQMRRKAMKQGFELNIMVVGQSGLGKSTLMNTLFKSKVSRKSAQPNPEEKIPQTIEIKSISHDIEEKGVRMKLAVIDTPGFGDQINNENCWQPIMKFINDQYEAYLQEEINIDRKKRIPDSRVHCCIYFIPPTGHCLRPLDVEFMRRLSKVVNIVPVIAKADTLTLEERDDFKQTIREELRANGIDVYPQKEFDEDAEDRLINDKIREMIPFAVVGSDQEYQVNGKKILGRKTKWGTIEVENIAHCEFAYLRDLLIRTHMQNIKDITGSIHYEMYRVRRLNESNAGPGLAPGQAPTLVSAHTNGQTKVNGGPPNGMAAQCEVLTHEM
ncbi:septin 9b isoform X2 [Gadus morhua]|uniref:Septin 9b n=1 Tax=Gadus morhua TaxID=8049 RepID=A0A8C5BCW0_GADMO|nr:neuronal-specific septin-3-like isoform X2 [Gadus morhua]